MSASHPPGARRAVILFAHGARDPRWSAPLHTLVDAVRQRLPGAHVAAAFLELQSPSLDAALAEAASQRCTDVDVVPIFWAAAGHVASEVPAVIDAFRAQHAHVMVRLLPTLSELPGLLDFVANAIVGDPQSSRQ